MVITMYCKMINGVPQQLLLPLVTEEGLYFGNGEETIKAAGYKILEVSEKPVSEGFYALPCWEETGDAILQSWSVYSLKSEALV